MNALQINDELTRIEEQIRIAENNRDVARSRAMNNLGDKIGTDINSLLAKWEKLYYKLPRH